MNKKASILTFHCVPNYGAVLQAYALQEVLKNFFDEVEILDYRPNNLTREYNVINYYSVFSVAATLFSSSSFKKKKQRFFEYENKYFNLSSQHIINISSLKNYRTDALFLGSDQIWNPDITNGFDKAYFGKFDIADSTKVISYAASIGKNSFTNTQSYILNYLLNGIDVISVRESQAKDILQNLCDKSIEVVADPTILAGREYFDCCVCSLDGINHLTDIVEVKKCFDCVYNSLNDGGIFVFDVNTVYKHKNVLGNNTFVFDEEDFFLSWDNEYLGDNTVRILLDFFVYNGKNYDRFSEEFNEIAYSVNELKSVLNNFNIIGIYDELNLNDIKEDSERIYFVLKKGDN